MLAVEWTTGQTPRYTLYTADQFGLQYIYGIAAYRAWKCFLVQDDVKSLSRQGKIRASTGRAGNKPEMIAIGYPPATNSTASPQSTNANSFASSSTWAYCSHGRQLRLRVARGSFALDQKCVAKLDFVRRRRSAISSR